MHKKFLILTVISSVDIHVSICLSVFYLWVVEVLGHRLDDTDNDGFKSLSFRVVVQYGGSIFWPFCAAERGRSHSRVDRLEMVW